MQNRSDQWRVVVVSFAFLKRTFLELPTALEFLKLQHELKATLFAMDVEFYAISSQEIFETIEIQIVVLNWTKSNYKCFSSNLHMFEVKFCKLQTRINALNDKDILTKISPGNSHENDLLRNYALQTLCYIHQNQILGHSQNLLRAR